MNTLEQYELDLIDQIARDSWTLDNCPDPAPDIAFYIERISRNREEVLRLQEIRHGHNRS